MTTPRPESAKPDRRRRRKADNPHNPADIAKIEAGRAVVRYLPVMRSGIARRATPGTASKRPTNRRHRRCFDEHRDARDLRGTKPRAVMMRGKLRRSKLGRNVVPRYRPLRAERNPFPSTVETSPLLQTERSVALKPGEKPAQNTSVAISTTWITAQ